MDLSAPVPRLPLLHLHTLHSPVALISIDNSLSPQCPCCVQYERPITLDPTSSYTTHLLNITNCAPEPHSSRRTCPISATAHRVADHHRREHPQPSAPTPPENTRYIWAFAPAAWQIWPFLQWPKGPPSQQCPCPCRLACVTARPLHLPFPTPKGRRP